MARYEAGETLASIARTYDCSPPAISYVVSRSRARPAGARNAAKPAGPAEPQLIKNPAPTAAPPRQEALSLDRPRRANGSAGNDDGPAAAILAPAIPEATAPAWQRPPASVPPDNGDQRGTLHLSIGRAAPDDGGLPAADGQGDRSGPGSRDRQPPAGAAPPYRGHDGAAAGAAEARSAAYGGPDRQGDGAAAPRPQGASSFIDRELRARVDGDIAAFLAAFDDALAQDTPHSRSALRDATDRLLRAGARTRIELERLEARLPLPARDHGGRGELPPWRQR